MIPSIADLQAMADAIRASVPSDVAAGRVATALYGMGFVGRWALPRLTASGVRIAGCYDGNPELAGSFIGGIPVHAAGRLKNDAPPFVLITARHAVAPVSALLTGLGIAHASYDAWRVACHFDRFRRIYERFADERSREVMRAVVAAMLTGDQRHCRPVFDKDQYFCLPPFSGGSNESYVDAGAFVGDSVERFVWAQNGAFCKIFAFEPGARQFAALQTRTKRLAAEWALHPEQIELVAAGLGEREQTLSAASSDRAPTNLTLRDHVSGEPSGGETARVVALDRFLDGRRITFLKADVEGMEMDLIAGARATIRAQRPKLAICAYHHPEDIADIAEAVSDLVPDYEIALRHHSPQLMETVLYCWAD